MLTRLWTCNKIATTVEYGCWVTLHAFYIMWNLKHWLTRWWKITARGSSIGWLMWTRWETANLNLWCMVHHSGWSQHIPSFFPFHGILLSGLTVTSEVLSRKRRYHLLNMTMSLYLWNTWRSKTRKHAMQDWQNSNASVLQMLQRGRKLTNG